MKYKHNITYLLLITICFSVSSIAATQKNLFKVQSIENEKNLYSIGGEGWEQGLKLFRNDSGYVFLSNSIHTLNNSLDIKLGELNSNAEVEEIHSYGGTNRDLATDGIRTDDGGFIILAQSQSLFNSFFKKAKLSRPERNILFKIAPTFDMSWGIDFQSGQYDSVIEDNSFIYISGLKFSESRKHQHLYQGLLSKLDNAGHLLWQKTYTTNPNSYIRFNKILKGQNNKNYIIASVTQDNSYTVYGFGLIHFEEDGDINANSFYFPKNNDYIFIRNGKALEDGSVILCGDIANSLDSSADMFFCKISSEGAIEWAKKVSHDNHTFSGIDIEEKNNKIYVTGFVQTEQPQSNTNSLYLECDLNGNILSTLENNFYGFDTPNQMICSDNEITSIGSIHTDEKSQNILFQIIDIKNDLEENSINITISDVELYQENIELTIDTKKSTPGIIRKMKHSIN